MDLVLESPVDPEATRKSNRRVLERVKPDASPALKMIKLKLSSFGHIRSRRSFFGKDSNAGKIEGSRKEKTEYETD